MWVHFRLSADVLLFFRLIPLKLQEDNYEEYFFSYSDVATSGLPSVIDEISTEEASMLVCTCSYLLTYLLIIYNFRCVLFMRWLDNVHGMKSMLKHSLVIFAFSSFSFQCLPPSLPTSLPPSLTISLFPSFSLSLSLFSLSCEYIHGELCDMCFKHSLNPHDPNQQKGTHVHSYWPLVSQGWANIFNYKYYKNDINYMYM